MRVTEIYCSIQGETAHAGRPCTLVRTTGCDLRCGYCDTAYAFYGGTERTLDEVVGEVERLGPRLVLLTGGEPLLQRETSALASALLARGFEVMIETSGAHDVAVLAEGVIKIVDVKTPGSGESASMLWANLERLRPVDAAKFVLTSQADYAWSRGVIREWRLEERTQVLLSPAHGLLDPRELVAWMLRDRLRARLNLQIHKYIWGADARGV
jgi:7-carboxy-7-deazaguanine synthase